MARIIKLGYFRKLYNEFEHGLISMSRMVEQLDNKAKEGNKKLVVKLRTLKSVIQLTKDKVGINTINEIIEELKP